LSLPVSKPLSGGGEGEPSHLEIRSIAGGSLVRVRLTPKASANAFNGIAEGALRLRIQSPPVDGAANAKAREFLAKALGISRGAVSLERGAASRDKVFRIEGLAPDDLRARLLRLLG